MEEGERLSKKQMAQENTIKKLRGELAELRSEKGSSSASLAAERQKVRARLLMWQLSGIPFTCRMGTDMHVQAVTCSESTSRPSV